MKKILFIILGCFLLLEANSQVAVFGNIFLNGEKLANSKLTIKTAKGVVQQTIETKSASNYSFEVEYGQNFIVLIENERTFPMFFEIITDKVPLRLYDNIMGHEMDAGLYSKENERVDTAMLRKPFYRIVWDTHKKMVDDPIYEEEFDKHILKPQEHASITGKIFINDSKVNTLKNTLVNIYDKNGVKIGSTFTNRYGAFLFVNVIPADIVRMEVESDDPQLNGSRLRIATEKNDSLLVSKVENGKCNLIFTPELAKSVSDSAYTSNIGGKLISASSKEKKFFANKNVYLTDSSNKIIHQTKSNTLGSFVFEDVKPNREYLLEVDKKELKPGERIDMLTKDDNYIATLDSVIGDKNALKINSTYNKVFNDLSIEEKEIKMEVKATIFGDNVNHPIGKLKVLLLNDAYEVIDSAYTDNLGTFKFKYLPFLKRFYLSAENTDNILDVFQNILIYSSDANLIKIMTHQKGSKFLYNAVSAEIAKLRDVELEDPWLEYVTKIDVKKGKTEIKKEEEIKGTSSDNKVLAKEEKKTEKEGRKTAKMESSSKKEESKTSADNNPTANVNENEAAAPRSITEQIHFELNKANLTPESKEILDKIILVLHTNKKLKIEICGHTDSKGPADFNLNLSTVRANTVKSYITHAGIKSKRLSAKGFGETQLLNNCADGATCTDDEHALNRRIEFKIVAE